MGIFDGILFCSDLDGTLIYDGKVSEENCRAIRYFQENGGLFTLSTGRFPQYISKISDGFSPNTYIIGVNGAQIYDPTSDRVVYEGSLGLESFVPTLKEICESLTGSIRVALYTEEGDVYFESNDVFAEIRKLEGKKVYKALVIVPTGMSDEACQTVTRICSDRYNVSRSWVNGLEILAPVDSKGDAIRRVRALLGDRVREVVAVGDYENDISMLIEADTAFAVENATDSVKAVADHITVPYSDHAIAEIVKFLENR